jgi:DNA processing protein
MLGVQSLGPIVSRCVEEEVRTVQSAVGEGREGASSPIVSEAARLAAAACVATERDAWVTLLSVQGLGPVSFSALLAAFGSARGVLAAAAGPTGSERLIAALADTSADEERGREAATFQGIFDGCAPDGDDVSSPGVTATRHRPMIGADLATRICDVAAKGSPVVAQARALGLTVVTLEERAYPERLRLVDLPPPLLFVRGPVEAMSAAHAVAVVGTRRPTDKGRLIGGWVGSALARAGAAVISGLAVGIDGSAHAAVVAEGGTTVAVLGGGHARLFPKAHERLADAIVDSGGAVVSELPPDTNPTRGTFPRRNRLVSGLSDATVVVEAGRRSGALITAGWALEQGRDCFLVPGPFDSPMSASCHAFLRSFSSQARIVAGIPELIEDLGLEFDEAANTSVSSSAPRGGSSPSSSTAGAGKSAVLAMLRPAELVLARQLARGPATVDQLAGATSFSGAAVLSALTLLELRGLVRCAYGRYSPAGALAGW